MNKVERILDANFNRAREALRVLEDAARFLLDDGDLAGLGKSLRHDLTALMKWVPDAVLQRDTPGDVGTEIRTAGEMSRADGVAVIDSAAGRLSEALRSMEEFAKALEIADRSMLAQELERLRYRGYELHRRLVFAMGSSARRQWSLCLLISEADCGGRPWLEVARAAVIGGGTGAADKASPSGGEAVVEGGLRGVDCLQLRCKGLDDRAWLSAAVELVGLGRELGVAVIVNDRPDLALLAGADGVHLGQQDLPIEAVRRLVGRQMLIGVSTSCMEEAEAAVAGGADYVGLGPMFVSRTKTKPVLSGPAYARAFIERFPGFPHLAISGIEPSNAAELVAVGVRGFAVCGVICRAEDPGDVAGKLRAVLNYRA